MAKSHRLTNDFIRPNEMNGTAQKAANETVGEDNDKGGDLANTAKVLGETGKPWAPVKDSGYQPVTQDANFTPYRGGEAHGVPTKYPAKPGDQYPNVTGDGVNIANATPPVEKWETLTEIAPVPVKVVENAPGDAVETHFSTNTYTLPPTTTPFTYVQVAGKRKTRKKIRISVAQITGSTSDVIGVGNDKDFTLATCYLLACSGDNNAVNTVEIGTTQPVWIAITSNFGLGAQVSVMEEYDKILPHKE